MFQCQFGGLLLPALLQQLNSKLKMIGCNINFYKGITII
jgi:hypothetical protein